MELRSKKYGSYAVFAGRGSEKAAIEWGKGQTAKNQKTGYFNRNGQILSTSYGLVSGMDVSGHWWSSKKTVGEAYAELTKTA